MAPSKDKWIRRFIITETKRHKKGFTIYKVTSMIFLKVSHEEISKVSVWKRYNDFKKLHSELKILHKRLDIKENFPTFPKSKYFNRFETEVVEERKKCALKFLEFVGKYLYLYSSDTFITFFETSHMDSSSNYAHSSSSTHSDTSEDDCIVTKNDSLIVRDSMALGTFQTLCLPKTPCDISTNLCSIAPNTDMNENKFIESQTNKSRSAINLQSAIVKKDEQSNKTTKLYGQSIITRSCNVENVKNNNLNENNVTTLSNEEFNDNWNNNVSRNFSNCNIEHFNCATIPQERVEFSQMQSEPVQYLLKAAVHLSAACKHESTAEFEEAFVQYKLGISCLANGVQFDSNSARVVNVKNKISKYLAQAEQLYNKYLNYNISAMNRPVSELQYYKVLKVIKSVMLVMDIRANCDRIIKPIEKFSVQEDNIIHYILQGQVPYMVHLYAYVETETTVFLILQYASCGKLWDFVRLHYKRFDSNYVCTDKRVDEDINSDEVNENIIKPNKTDKVIKNNKLQNIIPTNVRSEIYNTEVPTMQLLEKSQKLLQSVNATLRKSNSIVNRLNESNESRQLENVTSLSNSRAVTQISQKSNLILSNSVADVTINANFSTKNFISNKTLKDNSVNNNENPVRTENICASAKGNCVTYNSSLVKNKTSDLQAVDNSASKTISMQNVLTNSTMHIRENNDIKDISNRFLNINCNIDKTQYSYEKNDIEEELWQIPETVIRTWMAEILLALEALHQQNILIHDLNPDKILIDKTNHVRLTYIIPQRNMEFSKLKYPYSSPESIRFSPIVAVTSATDIWSVGVILYELLTGITFVTKHPGSFHSHSILDIPSNLSENGKSLLYGMLKYYPEERLTIKEIKSHPFFAEINWFRMVDST